VPARGGLKITPTPPGGCYDPRSPSGPPPVFGGPLVQCDGWRRRILTPPPDRQDRIEAVAVRMATLVDLVIDDVSRPVVDKTGFEQPFNFVLEFTPNVAVSDYRGPSTLPDAGPSAAPVPISTALQEQLGIQLRSAEAPVETIVQTEAWDLEPLDTWVSGRVALLGDSAHATTPFASMGACMTIQDSVALARELVSDAPLDDALRTYQQARKARDEAVVAKSRKMGKLSMMHSPIAGWLRDEAFTHMPADKMREVTEEMAKGE